MVTGEDNLQRDLSNLLLRVKEMPGLPELFQAYGEYESFVKQVQVYFEESQPKETLSTVDHS